MEELEFPEEPEVEGANTRPEPPDGEQFDETVAPDDEEAPGAAAIRLSPQGAAFVARFEGCKLALYNDPVGHCTIGIGHLVHHGRCNGSEPAELKQGITRERAVQLLQQDAAAIARALQRNLRVAVNQQQADALLSWGFNCGAGVFQTSTLMRKLNAGDFASVASELARWDKAGSPPRPVLGLTRRRAAEGRLFAQGKYA